MRWPSVYFWGWALVPGRFVLFFGALLFAGLAAGWAETLGAEPLSFAWIFVPLFIALALLSMRLLACPRCGRDAYSRGRFFSNNAWPVKTCTKCGLDLRRHHPFDKQARAARRQILGD